MLLMIMVLLQSHGVRADDAGASAMDPSIDPLAPTLKRLKYYAEHPNSPETYMVFLGGLALYLGLPLITELPVGLWKMAATLIRGSKTSREFVGRLEDLKKKYPTIELLEELSHEVARYDDRVKEYENEKARWEKLKAQYPPLIKNRSAWNAVLKEAELRVYKKKLGVSLQENVIKDTARRIARNGEALLDHMREWDPKFFEKMPAMNIPIVVARPHTTDADSYQPNQYYLLDREGNPVRIDFADLSRMLGADANKLCQLQMSFLTDKRRRVREALSHFKIPGIRIIAAGSLGLGAYTAHSVYVSYFKKSPLDVSSERFVEGQARLRSTIDITTQLQQNSNVKPFVDTVTELLRAPSLHSTLQSHLRAKLTPEERAGISLDEKLQLLDPSRELTPEERKNLDAKIRTALAIAARETLKKESPTTAELIDILNGEWNRELDRDANLEKRGELLIHFYRELINQLVPELGSGSDSIGSRVQYGDVLRLMQDTQTRLEGDATKAVPPVRVPGGTTAVDKTQQQKQTTMAAPGPEQLSADVLASESIPVSASVPAFADPARANEEDENLVLAQP